MLRKILDLLPGVLLCVAITIVALVLQAIEVHFAGEPYLEALVAAILIGVAIRSVWQPSGFWDPGIRFSAKFLLEVAIVLLGASLSATAVLDLGPLLLVGIAATVVMAIFASYAIGRAFGLPQRMAILVACGNSICGNSAIAAVAPIIGADGDDVASSIAFTAVLGVVVVLALPFLVPILHLSLTQYGVLAGLTVYAVPQVLAATLPIGALANQIGTVVKLVRVLMLGPVVFGLSLVAGRLRRTASPDQTAAGSKLKFGELVPWFIVGFLVAALARSFGFIPQGAIKPIVTVAGLLTTVSMAALGLGVDIRVVARAGARVTAAVTVSLIALAVISLVLIHVTGIQ
ncbi:MAG: putative sulfate exporter family transporter [Pseudolabrys sp.]|nr:putative sulfate exporter family transporter [Pseudolabrys sp.]